MSADRMFDLAIAPLQNGGFQLSQQGSRLDEPDVIELHPIQVRYLAQRADLIPAPDPDLLDRLSARHVRRLHALRDKAVDLFELLASVPCFPPQSRETEDVTAARDLVELVDDLLDDTDTAPPAEPVTEKSEAKQAVSVTPKRGRPKKENALTDAERQARHRARQVELQLSTTAKKEQPCPN